MQTSRMRAANNSPADLPLDPDQSGDVSSKPHLLTQLQVAVFIGGCLGTATRYGVSLTMPTSAHGWPLGTFTVNLIGAFSLGWLLQILSHMGKDVGLRRVLRLGIGTGFIGGFTTYSSLAVETDLLIRAGHGVLAMSYVVTSVACGIFMCALGIKSASLHFRRTRRPA
jgi:CrcB protein